MKSLSAWVILSGFVVVPATLDAMPDDGHLSTAEPTSLRKLYAKHLPNALQVHSKVISGGLPDGEEAFAELSELGVKTIVSVDGATPNLELAKKHGMRYVHLPHGYSGIPQHRSMELAKAVRDLEGPIYIHCHHGKHRSPTAAAVACVASGFIDPSVSLEILKMAGTSEHYVGLFASARSACRVSDEKLDAIKSEFPEISELPPMAEAMVSIDRIHEHLKSSSDSNWHVGDDAAIRDAAYQALLLSEHYTELLRQPSTAERPKGFLELLKQSEADCKELDTSIRAWIDHPEIGSAPRSITAPFARISTNCTTCHRSYRDAADLPNQK